MRPDPAKSCGPYHLPEQRVPRSTAAARSTASSAQRHVNSLNADVSAGAGSERTSANDSGSRDVSDRWAGDGEAVDNGSRQRQPAASRWLLPSGRDAEASLQVLSAKRQQLPISGGSGGAAIGAAEPQPAPDAAAEGGAAATRRLPRTDELNHDTIAMVAIDAKGRIAAGASSNGANHKVPWSDTEACSYEAEP